MALLCNMAAPPKSVSGQVMGTKHPSPWKGGMGQASPYSAGTHVTKQQQQQQQQLQLHNNYN